MQSEEAGFDAKVLPLIPVEDYTIYLLISTNLKQIS
jgi:hypothetical protein